MKIQFDSSQQFQLEAIQGVIDIFEGQPIGNNDFDLSFDKNESSLSFSEKGVGNNLILTKEQIFKNVNSVQKRNRIKISDSLEPVIYHKPEDYTLADFEKEPEFIKESLDIDSSVPYTFQFFNNFTVEMETGTGKTYTYLRTIYELNKIYGFLKFVIVVPGVAIREGVIKSLIDTHEHFQILYENPSIDFAVYDSGSKEQLRNYAIAHSIQILVISIDSFTKDANIINTKRENGYKPIEFIQKVRPIIIVDEPQNMETDIRRAAIHNLNPLCTLRYSATHRNFYNLIYSLNPVQAYDMGLVKQIEVDGISSDNDYNNAYIEFHGIQQGKRDVKAKLSIYVNDKSGVKKKTIKAGLGDDLLDLSGGRDMYRGNFIINSINATEGSVLFSNGCIIKEGQTQGDLTDEVMKLQIERTIKWHFEKEIGLKNREIKVLSLFFIDRVANYREYLPDGTTIKGKFAIWFEELFDKYAPKDYPFKAEEVHNGYFSQDAKGQIKDTKGTTKADDDTYSLIMREKQRLLDNNVPLRFVFSHSALREGWDNPNVFQICTLNETQSDLKKRQEIGRGLRLPVDSNGIRVWDKNINVLTVIANESYSEFSSALQKEIQEDTSVDFGSRIKNAREKKKVRLSKELTVSNYPLFFEIWDIIKQRTHYHVEYSTQALIETAIKEIKDMPKTIKPKFIAEKHRISYKEEGIEGRLQEVEYKEVDRNSYMIPDIYKYIQRQIDITRNTIFEILKGSNRYDEILINPQMFLDNVVLAIKTALNKLLVDGVKYEKIQGVDSAYSMELFYNEEVETYLTNLFEVTDLSKTLYNYIQYDSGPESEFAKACEANDSIKFYFKLPRGFKIPTPIGNYVPDWAIVFEGDKKIYFVVETKSTLNKDGLRGFEKLKIMCGKKHFALFKPQNLEYKHVTKLSELIFG